MIRATKLFVLTLLFLLVPMEALRADQGDPSDAYLAAYLTMQEADKLNKEEKYHKAGTKYSEASELFDAVARNHPSWNPQMVNFRRKKIRESLRICKKTIAALPPIPAGPASPLFPVAEKSKARTVPVQPAAGDQFGNIANQVQRQLDQKTERIEALETEKSRMAKSLTDRDALLKLTQQQLIDAKETQDQIVKSIAIKEREYEKAQAEGKVETGKMKLEIAELRNELKKAAEGMKVANEKSTEILNELEKANTMITRLKKERDEITAERDSMETLMKSTLSKKGGFEALMTENERLRNELKTAQAAVVKLTAEKGDSDAQVKELQSKVAEITAEVVQLRKENAEYKSQVAELRNKLVTMKEHLVMQVPPPANLAANQENKKLRQFILRQLRQHTVAQQKKELVLAELERLEINSKSLLFSIDELARVGDMDEAEKRFLADRGFEDILTDGAAPVRVGDGVESETIVLENLFKAASYDFSQKSYKAAEAGYQRILATEPAHVPSLHNLGVVKLHMGQRDASRDFFDRVLKEVPDHAYAHYMKGVSFYQQQMHGDAKKCFAKTLASMPENSKAHHYLGVIAFSGGDIPIAEENFQQALSISPELADSHFNLAVLYGSSEPPNPVRARKHYAEALKLGVPRDMGLEELIGPMEVKKPASVSSLSN